MVRCWRQLKGMGRRRKAESPELRQPAAKCPGRLCPNRGGVTPSSVFGEHFRAKADHVQDRRCLASECCAQVLWGGRKCPTPRAGRAPPAAPSWSVWVGNSKHMLPGHSVGSLFPSSFGFPLGDSHPHHRISIPALRTK